MCVRCQTRVPLRWHSGAGGGDFAHFGVPAELDSVQGQIVEAQVFREVCRWLGACKTRMTPARSIPKVMGWWKVFTAPWPPSSPSPPVNTNRTGTATYPWAYDPTELPSKSPASAHPPLTCLDASSGHWWTASDTRCWGQALL